MKLIYKKFIKKNQYFVFEVKFLYRGYNKIVMVETYTHRGKVM